MLETNYLPVSVLRAESKLKLLYERIELNEFRTIPVKIPVKVYITVDRDTNPTYFWLTKNFCSC